MSPAPVVRSVLNASLTLCTANGTLPIYMAVIRNTTTLVNATNTARIRVKEEGNYICRATSKYGTDERTFIVVDCESPSLFLLINTRLENRPLDVFSPVFHILQNTYSSWRTIMISMTCKENFFYPIFYSDTKTL